MVQISGADISAKHRDQTTVPCLALYFDQPPIKKCGISKAKTPTDNSEVKITQEIAVFTTRIMESLCDIIAASFSYPNQRQIQEKKVYGMIT